MAPFPRRVVDAMNPTQGTLARDVEFSGVGIHTGEPAHVRLRPAPPDTGRVFRRVDVDPAVAIPATVESVVDTELRTTLGRGEVRIQTVEHLLAALAATEIDNVIIDIDGPEVPVLDGSARPFVELIHRAGRQDQGRPAATLALETPVTVQLGDVQYAWLPSERWVVSCAIEFPHPCIGRQFVSFPIDPETFAQQVAPARTFGFLGEAAALQSRGLARGAATENTLVLTDEGLHPEVRLRFPDEFARHKLLDIVGDLALAGRRIRGQVVAERPSHRGNIELVRAALRAARPRGAVLDARAILQRLPHRYPFLLVDRIVEVEEGKRIVGIKNVTINEPFFVGHFPGHPIMPGVLLVEAMAQVGGVLLLDSLGQPEDKVVYFLALDNVRWRRPVVPGDQIRFELEVLHIRGTTCKMRGIGTVDGQRVVEAEMMAKVVDR